MCPEGNAASCSSPPRPAVTSSPSGKRARDPEDEVYVDNLHSHKRYLSEIMASSLNGLKVGDSLSINLVDSSARDDISLQYSPMSEDSDDSRYCESSTNTFSSHPESIPTSPVSPYRCQKPPTGFASGPSTSHGCIFSNVASTQSRHRGSDSEGRFPSSPSDICHSADLRRAALLRSVQMRAHPMELSQFESPYSTCQESGNNMESEEQPCSCAKAVLDENEHQIAKFAPLCVANNENGVKPSCRTLDMNLKDEGSAG